MAYNSKNMLRKIIEIQDLTLKMKNRGISQRKIFETEIEQRYMISFSTFNRYLAINAKKDLKRMTG